MAYNIAAAWFRQWVEAAGSCALQAAASPAAIAAAEPRLIEQFLGEWGCLELPGCRILLDHGVEYPSVEEPSAAAIAFAAELGSLANGIIDVEGTECVRFDLVVLGVAHSYALPI